MNAETNLTGSNKFPVKLYNILQEAEKSPYLADIVSWTPDGRSFKVSGHHLRGFPPLHLE